jgi:DNA mismatch repair protein MutL
MSIKKLPIQLANQIAAGEVIERPASVIKECIENSIDANATEIIVDVERGGMERLCIRDNGKGVDKNELPLMIEPHATSKISKVEDLNRIMTLGFRGEALASISAVSRCRIASKTAGKTIASQLYTEGGTSFSLQSTPHPEGTTVEIRDLFFNVPVRRTFLKNEKTEFLHIETVFKRLAFSHFDVAFSLSHNGKFLFSLPAAHDQLGREKRIAKLFGKAFMAQAIPIDVENERLRLTGYLGAPSFLRSQNDLQSMYINTRMVRDKLINHAIKQVYDPFLFPGRVPSYLLFLSIPPTDVDINVHPTKHEVRFKHARETHDFIASAVRQHLSIKEESPVSDTKGNENDVHLGDILNEKIHIDEFDSDLTIGNTLIHLGGQYALSKLNADTYIFDYVALYESMIYDKLLSALKEENISSRPLLVPSIHTLTEKELAQFPFSLAEKVGLDMSPVDVDKILVRGFPVLTPHLDFNACVRRFAVVKTIDEALKAVSQSQKIEFDAFSKEERAYLMRQLPTYQKAKNKKTCCRVLNHHDWAALLHV